MVSVMEFMESGGTKLKAHILKKINSENYIGGDESKIVHIKVGNKIGELCTGVSYLFIKPEKQDDETLVLNEKFKAVKVAKIHLSDKTISVNELFERLKESINIVGEACGDTFETIEAKPANAKVTKMTVKCLSISRIIESPYGEYRIAKLRDSNNNKGDINLNKHTKNKMEVGKLYHIENFKTSTYKAEGSEFRRLGTLPTTMIKALGSTEQKQWSHIRLGDEEASGDCIGIGKTFGYFGCANCWKKVEVDATFCTKCSAATETRTMEFSTELYIEIDDKILTLQGFRRQFPQLKVESIEAEDIEELMEKEFVGKKIDMEFNEGDEDESKKLVKIKKIGV